MVSLIETLRRQHRQIEGRAEELTAALSAGDRQEVNLALLQLRSALIAHVALEDVELYPAMASVRDGEAARMVGRSFATTMSQLSQVLVAFFKGAIGANLAELREQWKDIHTLLVTRIAWEEQVLYPLYLREVSGMGQGQQSA